MKVSKENIIKHQEFWKELEIQVFQLARKVATEMGYKNVDRWEDKNLEFNGTNFYADFEYYVCGESDYTTVQFPYEYLSMPDEDMIVDIKKKIQERKEKDIREAKEKEEKKTEMRRKGRTLKIRPGWEGATTECRQLGSPIKGQDGQLWTPVEFNDGEGPTLQKTASLEPAYPEENELVKRGFI